jgi:hypothetical protein
MTKKPITLLDATVKKQLTEVAEKAAANPTSPATRTLTLRLPPIVHDQLREMAFTSRRSQHALLLEGLNMLFERHGRPPIAS